MTKRKKLVILFVIIVILVLFGFFMYGKFQKPITNSSTITNTTPTAGKNEPATSPSAPVANKNLNTAPAVPVPDNISNVCVAKKDLPKDFPTDVPVYCPASITTSSYFEKNHTFYLLMSSADQYSTIKKFYINNLASGGWSIDIEPIEIINNEGSAVTYVAYKDDRQISMQIRVLGEENSGNSTTISLTTSDKIVF